MDRDDIRARAQDFSTLEQQSTQNVLVAPFIEEAFHHEPKTASARLKAAVVVVVRNGLLEGAHADGQVRASQLGIERHGSGCATGRVRDPDDHYEQRRPVDEQRCRCQSDDHQERCGDGTRCSGHAGR